MRDLIRQGDVLFSRIGEEGIPAEAKIVPSGVIQEGEATGHDHRVADVQAAEVFEVTNWRGVEKFVRVTEGGVSIVHVDARGVKADHFPVQLPAGTYRVKIAREHDYLQDAARYMVD